MQRWPDEGRNAGSGDDWAVLDRHALVMAVWLALGFLALSLLARGVLARDPWLVSAGFATVVAGFAAHVIINAVGGTRFTPREVALGLVVYGLGLSWFLLSLLFRNEVALELFVPLSLGFLAVTAAVIFYMLTHFGVRGAFTAFDVIRDFGPPDSPRDREQ